MPLVRVDPAGARAGGARCAARRCPARGESGPPAEHPGPVTCRSTSSLDDWVSCHGTARWWSCAGRATDRHVRMLRGAGVDAVYLAGGLRAWSATGLPLVTDGREPGRVA